MQEFTAALVKQIQDINGDPGLTAEMKAAAIKNLKGVSQQDALDFMERNFRTGMALDKDIQKAISPSRLDKLRKRGSNLE